MTSQPLENLNTVSGKLALITGCTGGIGKASAHALARLGCSIAVHYHSADAVVVDALCNELHSRGVKAEAFQADLSTYDGARKLHAQVVSKMGEPDILFNNAGVTTKVIGGDGDIHDITPEMFEETWRTNTGTHFLAIANRAWDYSVAAGTGGGVGPHYASSKSAMHGLVHWIATRYAKQGITCNAVAPALIDDTKMIGNSSKLASLKERIPVGRLGKPEEIASVVELFVTNAYMTNKIIVADGGMAPSAF